MWISCWKSWTNPSRAFLRELELVRVETGCNQRHHVSGDYFELLGIVGPAETARSIDDKQHDGHVPGDRSGGGNPMAARLVRLAPVNQKPGVALVAVPISLKIGKHSLQKV